MTSREHTDILKKWKGKANTSSKKAAAEIIRILEAAEAHIKGAGGIDAAEEMVNRLRSEVTAILTEAGQDAYSTGLSAAEEIILRSSVALQKAGLSKQDATGFATDALRTLIVKRDEPNNPEVVKILEQLFTRNGLKKADAKQVYTEFMQTVTDKLHRLNKELEENQVPGPIGELLGDEALFEVLQRWEDKLTVDISAYKKLGYAIPAGPSISLLYSIEYALRKAEQAEKKAKEAERKAKQAEARAKKAEQTTKALQKKQSTFKISSHLPEQMLKGPQLSLFEEVLEDITEEPYTQTVHLNLSATESLLVLSLGKILHLISQTDNPEAQDYYLGNRQDIPEELRNSERTTKPVLKEDPGEKLPVPQMIVPTQQIAWEYMGKKPSGPDLETVENMLKSLADRKFKVTYVKKTVGKGARGKTVYDEKTIEIEAPLISLGTVTQRRSEEGGLTQERSTKIITFNPIFIDQIRSKYQEFPEDYIKRLRDAWPGRAIPKTLTQLGLYLNQIRSKKGNQLEPHTIYTTTLMEKLDPATYKKSKKRAIEQAERSLDCCRECGFIASWDKQPGQTGELLYQIHINKKW